MTSPRMALAQLDDKSVEILTKLITHLIKTDSNSVELFQEVIFDQTMKLDTEELFTVSLIEAPDFFRVLKEKGVCDEEIEDHENLREFLMLDADYPDFINLKNLRKALDQMAQNDAFMAVIMEDLRDQMPAATEQV